MFWNVASARYEISLRKWSRGIAQLRTLGALIAKKMRFVGSNAYFSLMFLCT